MQLWRCTLRQPTDASRPSRDHHLGAKSRTVGGLVHDGCMSPTALQLVLGEEEFLVERAVEAIVAEVRAVDPTAELRRIRAGETTPADLVESLSPSLFAEGRVVVLLASHEAGKDLTAAVLEAGGRSRRGHGAGGAARGRGAQQGAGRCAAQGEAHRHHVRSGHPLRGAGGVRARRGAAGGRAHRPGRRPGADRGGRDRICGSWPRPRRSWSPTPAAPSTSRPCGATTAGAPSRPGSRWPTRWSSAIARARWRRCAGPRCWGCRPC